jgi:hypothetical protein
VREFPLRERYRVLVFTRPKVHNTDAKGRSIDSYPLLSFSDVEDHFVMQPGPSPVLELKDCAVTRVHLP